MRSSRRRGWRWAQPLIEAGRPLLLAASCAGLLAAAGCAAAPKATLADDAPKAVAPGDRAATLRVVHNRLTSHPDAGAHEGALERALQWLELAEVRAAADPPGRNLALLLDAAEGELVLIKLALRVDEDR